MVFYSLSVLSKHNGMRWITSHLVFSIYFTSVYVPGATAVPPQPFLHPSHWNEHSFLLLLQFLAKEIQSKNVYYHNEELFPCSRGKYLLKTVWVWKTTASLWPLCPGAPKHSHYELSGHNKLHPSVVEFLLVTEVTRLRLIQTFITLLELWTCLK